MEFARLLEIVGDEPIFETGLLLAGNVNPKDVRRQLSRWAKAGKLYQLRRGVYALAPPYQKVTPHPFLVANYLVRSSYVSNQSALAYYGLIPEYVPAVTSVTTLRPRQWETLWGHYQFRHIKAEFFNDYRLVEVANIQQAFVATPEKSLLDLIYLHPGADSPEYLRELRLQNLEQLNFEQLQKLADFFNSPKLQRAISVVKQLVQEEEQDYEIL